MFVQKAILLDAPAMDRALMRMAHEIVEREPGSDLVLQGLSAGACLWLGSWRRI